MPRIFARMSTGVATDLERVEPIVFEVGHERLVKCFTTAFGMKRVRWA